MTSGSLRPTKAAIAELVCQLTGQSARHVANSISDEQVTGFALSISAVLTPDLIFTFEALDAWALAAGYTAPIPPG